MKVLLPENINDITLGQFQKYMKLAERVEDLSDLEFNKRKIAIFTNLPQRKVKHISKKDYDSILEQIDTALNTDVEFKDRFTLKGVEFGFHPNLDEMTTGEYVDLSKYGEEVENLHYIMAILFRPITGKDALGNYQIAGYIGTDGYKDLMKEMPLNIVNGSLVFFYNLAKELRISTQKSTAMLQRKVKELQDISKSGVGMPQL